MNTTTTALVPLTQKCRACGVQHELDMFRTSRVGERPSRKRTCDECVERVDRLIADGADTAAVMARVGVGTTLVYWRRTVRSVALRAGSVDADQVAVLHRDGRTPGDIADLLKLTRAHVVEMLDEAGLSGDDDRRRIHEQVRGMIDDATPVIEIARTLGISQTSITAVFPDAGGANMEHRSIMASIVSDQALKTVHDEIQRIELAA